jgi:DNA-binding MarR family transcriptional regulator
MSDALSVTLSGEDLEDVKRILSRIARAAERRFILDGAKPTNADAEDSEREDDPRERLALQVLAVREARERLLRDPVLAEPAWDMLLAVYLADRAGVRHTVGRIVELSRSSPTTALRHMECLEKAGLVDREQYPRDRRVFHLFLTGQGRRTVDKVLSWALKH